MPVPIAYYISGAGLTVLWFMILYRGWREEMLGRYRLFYAYVLLCAVVYWVRVTGYRFVDADTYSSLYSWTGIVVRVVAIALLIQVLRLGPRRGGTFRWLIVLSSTVLIFVTTTLETGSHWHVRVQNGLYAFATVLALVNLTRLRPLILGNNYYGILGGILIPNGLATINYLAYLSKLSWWPWEVFRLVSEPIVWVSWLVILAGMWRYSPPRPLNDYLQEVALERKEVQAC